jgi:hypothetical protein
MSGSQGPEVMVGTSMRSYDESCSIIDRIVGRCIRIPEFASSVLSDPEAALKEYNLNEDELDDFRALCAGHREEAGEVWETVRADMGAAKVLYEANS